jgi:drug/metabolite transporter (DMT)-like permease
LETKINYVKKSVILAHIYLFIVALIYGANYTIAKGVLSEGYMGPNGFIFLRVVSGALLFFLFHKVFVNEKVEKKDFGLIALCGLFGVAINQLCFFNGLKLTSPVNSSLIMLTTPILVLIASSIYIKERITSSKIIGILIGASGATLLILGNDNNPTNQSDIWGDVLILINASSYAIYLVLVKKLMKKYNPTTIVKWVFFFGVFYVSPFGIKEFLETQPSTFPVNIWLSIGFVIFGTTFLNYLLNAKALTVVNPSVVSAYIYLQPLIATLIAIIFSGFTLDKTTLSAAALIALGLYVSAFYKRN